MVKRRVKTKPLKEKYTIWNPDPNLSEEEREELRKKIGEIFQLDARGTISPNGRRSRVPGRPMSELEVKQMLRAWENHGRV